MFNKMGCFIHFIDYFRVIDFPPFYESLAFQDILFSILMEVINPPFVPTFTTSTSPFG